MGFTKRLSRRWRWRMEGRDVDGTFDLFPTIWMSWWWPWIHFLLNLRLFDVHFYFSHSSFTTFINASLRIPVDSFYFLFFIGLFLCMEQAGPKGDTLILYRKLSNRENYQGNHLRCPPHQKGSNRFYVTKPTLPPKFPFSFFCLFQWYIWANVSVRWQYYRPLYYL